MENAVNPDTMDGIMSAEDRLMLIEQFNDTENAATLGFSLPQLFEEAAERYPNHIAVISAGMEYDYQMLNGLANRLARVLIQESGLGRGDLVGVALDRSVDVVVAILAILKSGAAYAPIDPTFPTERITHTIDDARPKLVLTASEGALPALTSRRDLFCLHLDQLRSEMDNTDGTNLKLAIQPDDLAYVIYTSGSTGRPKGVEANHGALCNMLLSMRQAPGCSSRDRLLAVAPIAFDMSIFDMFVPLVSGATVAMAQTSELRDPGQLLGLMERHGVTMIQATPSFFQMLLNGGWEGTPRLSTVLTAGEPVPRRLLERLLGYADNVWEGYGPTEATVYSSVGRVTREDKDSVIGRPLANFRLYVLRPEDLSPVPLGAIGELYIGGVGVNCGYRNNPELTHKSFLETNPFHPGRLYRSGDLARFIAPGKLSLVGRTDSQVKVRGYRIELGDVSAAIVEHELVSEAIVLHRHNQLVAYYVRIKTASSLQSPSLDGVQLRAWLAKRRPSYIVPAYFIEMPAFPLTPNGKIDKRALPDPFAMPVVTAGPRATTTAVDESPPTRTELESRVQAIWSRVLGHDQFGIHDSFFDVGGDSIRIPHLKKLLEKTLGGPVPIPQLFEHHTIHTLAEYLEGRTKGSRSKDNTTQSKANGRPRQDTRKQEQQQQQQQQRHHAEDIAIISMACRFPGGITTPEEFWDLLETGGDVITDVPPGRWDASALYDADPGAPGKSYCRRGGFLLDEHVDSFDAPFFGISPREAQTMDPAQSVMLETCWEAFERAGYPLPRLRGSNTGVFVGQNPVGAHAAGRAMDQLDGYAVTGSIGAALSGRVSYVLGLEGPAVTVDTACSSSLVATHLACTALRQGECDAAVAGGVTIMPSPGLLVEFSRLRGISADGLCRVFDARSEGTGFSEGAAVVILKRLSDAQREGDTIHAVLRGSAVNHGGHNGVSLTTPSGAAQARLIRAALHVSGVSSEDIDYVEAHGTATKLGDPIEAAALADVFQDEGGSRAHPLWIGAVKSNIGHTQAAAGMAGVLKVVLAMQHAMLPRTLHVTEPTPLVDWQSADMALVLENRPWPPQQDPEKRRLAGVSSFGLSGTNAFVVVEEAPPFPSQEPATIANRSRGQSLPPVLPFLLSGRTDAALRQQAEKLYQYVSSMDLVGTDLGDVAFSLATTRSHFHRRLVVVARDRQDLLDKLALCSADGPSGLPPPAGVIVSRDSDSGAEPPRLVMLFSGQGSQRLGMGKSLYETWPAFGKALDDIAGHFTGVLEKPLLDVMWADDDSLLRRTDFAQPAMFALEVALWRLWQSWGIQPEVVMGHSVGEIAAAHVAGVFDLSDACRLVASRGRLMRALSRLGSMASVEATALEVEACIAGLDGLEGRVNIAGYNTPTQTVVSGDIDMVECVVAHFSHQLSRKTKMLDTSHAFHSFHVDEMLPSFRAVVETLRFHPCTLPVVSSLTGRLAEAGELQRPNYWVRQAREPVRFRDGVKTLSDHGVNVLLELGATPVLLGMAAVCLNADDNNSDRLPALLPSLSTGKQDDSVVMQRSLAELHVRQMPMDWSAYFQPFPGRRVQLPTYAFQRGRYYRRPHLPSKPPTQEESRVDRFQFEIHWRQIDLGREYSYTNGAKWGLLCPTGFGALASNIERVLSRAGIRVSFVQQLQDARQLDGLVCLWDDSSSAPSSSSSSIGDDAIPQQIREYTAKALAQLQTAAAIGFGPPLVWMTRNAVGISAKQQSLSAAPLWGLMRTARSEHPELRLRLIDLDLGNDKALQQDTATEPFLPALMLHDEPECIVKNHQLFVPQIQRAPRHVEQQEKEQSRPRLLGKDDGAVLITGGLGGLGKQVAKWLARTQHIRDLVLVSRRGMEAPGAEALVRELAQFGATATVVACEVGHLGSLRHKVMSLFSTERPLRGVIHAAGIVDNGILAAMTPERCTAVFVPKVDGAWHLHQLTRDMSLDFFVMFSSISGALGMPGLGNYAAANTFLDALAHARHAEGLPATSVAYGVWKGDGMAAGLTSRSTLASLAKSGLEPLIPQDGLDLLEQAMLSGRALTVAAALDPVRLRDYLLEEHADENGEMPRFYRALLQQNGSSGSGNGSNGSNMNNANGSKHHSPVKPGDKRVSPLRTALDDAASEKHAAIVLALVRETVAKVLSFTSAAQVDPTVPLRDIGFDSLTAVLMRNQLANLTGLKNLSASSITWNHPNLKSLSQFLLAEMQAQQAQAPAAGMNGTFTAVAAAKDGPDTTLAKKGYLDPQLSFHSSAQVSSPKSVFLTGATGFVGAYVLHELLERGIVAHCLVRARDAEHGAARLEAALAGYDLWKPFFSPLLHIVVGDASKPLFGLSKKVFDELADQVDAICHASALVDWMQPLDNYLGPNLVSAHEVLRMAAHGGRRGNKAIGVHMISTLAVLPMYLGYEVPESDREHGYSTSKYMAERIVAAARWRGAKASVYRLPFITAAASTGHFRLDRGDFLHNMIAGSLEMGTFPSLPGCDLSVVHPVDYLCRTVVDIMVDDRARIGHDFDFVNKYAVSTDRFFELMMGDDGPHEFLPFLEWQRRALDYAAEHPSSPLARIAAVVDGLADEEAAAAMFKPLPTSGQSFVLGGDLYPVPHVDQLLVRRYRDRIKLAAGRMSGSMNGSETNGANGVNGHGETLRNGTVVYAY